MSRNALYILIAALLVIALVLAFFIYQQQTRPGVELRVDNQGISIQGNS